MNSAVSRALRSRDQRRLGAPDNGMRRRTPTCPTGSGSPLAGPTMVCSSAMFPSRTPTELRVLLYADRPDNPAVGKQTRRLGDATSVRAHPNRPTAEILATRQLGRSDRSRSVSMDGYRPCVISLVPPLLRPRPEGLIVELAERLG